jgi:tRNA-binding protein
MATLDDFQKLDIRVGTITAAEPFPEARKPSFKLTIDFGPTIGLKRSSAQLTRRYTTDTLIGRQVVAVVNFPPRRIAGFASEVLVLGACPEEGDVVLLRADAAVPNGAPVA